jgi:predicted unusual protein kinase regulating ubiquinone biosynthesis (AarF/ABC1/UbiB family)
MTDPSELAGRSRSQAARYADLVRLLLRYGRSDLVTGAGLDEFLVDEELPTGDVDQAEAFAADLERMGPTYIKLGQLLSTRSDLLPPAYTEALTRLQDNVEPFPFEQVRETVEAELGAGLRHLFESFDERPLASASLGQVHRAITRSGRDVVVKVQRTGIREAVRDDMAVLERLAGLADDHTGAGRQWGFGRLLAQFRRTLAGELDYRRELRNLQRFRGLTADYEHIVVPEPLPDYSTSRVLTMEFIEGRKVTDVGPMGLLDVDTEPIVEELFACYLTMILDAGVLHVDPHPGNLLLTPDGRIALLDLGMVASVPPRIQTQVVKLLLAISDGDGEETAGVLASMGHPLPGYDAARFREDVAHLVSSAVEMGGGLQAGSVLVELSRLSGEHGLRPPAEMAMVGKALLNLDQATVHLDPSFAPAEAIRRNASQIMRGSLAVSPGGLMAAALEAKEFTSQLPRRANRILDALSEGELTVRVNAIDEGRLLTVLQKLANRLTMGLVLASIVVGAALMMQVPTQSRILGYPAIAMVFFLLAALGGAALLVWIIRTDRRIARQARHEDLRGTQG